MKDNALQLQPSQPISIPAEQVLAGKQAVLDVVIEQRNEALNRAAESAAHVSVLMAENARLAERIVELDRALNQAPQEAPPPQPAPPVRELS